MKEIDFLPDWYRQQRNQQISYRTKYVILGGVFFVIMALNFTSSFTVFRTKSLIAKTQPQVLAAEKISQEYAEVKATMEQIKKKEELLKKLDSKINVPGILAEISYLADEKVVLEKLELTSEKFNDQISNKPPKKVVSAVRTATIKNNKETEELYPEVRFKILIGGIAAGGSDVARLVCKLEDSEYFCKVVLLGSKPKNRKIISLDREEDCQVNEFEIICYIANYEYKNTDNLVSLPSSVNERIR